jgi:hypothetical protein
MAIQPTNQPVNSPRTPGTLQQGFSPKPVRELINTPELLSLVFILFHIPFALFARTNPQLSQVHAFGVFAIGMWWAITDVPIERVAYIVAYMVGSEVFWRSTWVTFDQFAKYGAAAICLVALLRTRTQRVPGLMLLYLLLLIPGILISIAGNQAELEWVRRVASFNLSGSLALAVCSWYFMHTRFTRHQMWRLLFAFAAPIVMLAVNATSSTLQNQATIYVISEGNIAYSGGFGPNQVSTILGLGGFMLTCMLVTLTPTRRGKYFLYAFIMWFWGQGMLTFSRGGILVGAFCAGLVGIQVVVTDSRRRGEYMLSLIAIAGLMNFVVLPQLENFTGGALGLRFSSLDTTNRDIIASTDIEIFLQHPLGVGVGQAPWYRQMSVGEEYASHTEFTRLLSEHGIAGLLCNIILFVSVFQNVTRRNHTLRSRAFVIGVGLWACLTMMHAAMRTAAPSILFAMMFATYDFDEDHQIRFSLPGAQMRQPLQRRPPPTP